MKTVISVPDSIFRAAERLAKRLGVSRSELYATAVAEFMSEHKNERVTERLNEVYGPDPGASQLDPEIAQLQAYSITKDEW